MLVYSVTCWNTYTSSICLPLVGFALEVAETLKRYTFLAFNDSVSVNVQLRCLPGQKRTRVGLFTTSAFSIPVTGCGAPKHTYV